MLTVTSLILMDLIVCEEKILLLCLFHALRSPIEEAKSGW